MRAGDISPADCIIFSDDILDIDQSVLTGESLTVEKKKGQIVYSGSIIRRGEENCFVYKTGRNTYFVKNSRISIYSKTKIAY